MRTPTSKATPPEEREAVWSRVQEVEKRLERLERVRDIMRRASDK